MKEKIVVILLSITLIGIIYLIPKNTINDISVSSITEKQIHTNSQIAMMFETEADSGEYVLSNDTTWPTGDYAFNVDLSKCENGSKISYDENTKKILLEANTSDKCYVYFDKIQTFANYIKKLHTSNGENNLYLHDTNLANSAEDESYRYAGSSETTNNFVCFGSDEEKCENDNLYRIIGVFNNQVKLIKYDYATTDQLRVDGDYNGKYSSITSYYKGILTSEELSAYYFNYNGLSNHDGNSKWGSKDWETSLLNQTNLNTNYVNYLNNQDIKWINMISDMKWNIGGHSTQETLAKTFYIAELTKQISESSKIGLMYVSDYGYATTPTGWGNNLYDYSLEQIKNNNWMYMGLNEWTITPDSSGSIYVFYLNQNGYIMSSTANGGNLIRPVFYLKDSVSYVSGDGTQNLPYRIK